MRQKTKDMVFDAVKKAYPKDLTIAEVAREIKITHYTVSMWLKVLEAEGKIEMSRRVGPAILYRFKK